MKTKAKKIISMITTVGILSALLAGCGGEEVTEVLQTETQTVQENPQEAMEMPEMQAIEISEEDAAALVQAGLDAVAEESELWSIAEIADTEALMELTQGQGGGERPEGEAFGGEQPENMTPPEGGFEERPDGEMPDGTMPEWDGENPPEGMEGAFPEGEKPEAGEGRGEDGGRHSGNRGGGMPTLAIVIANAEGAAVPVEDVLTAIETAAEALGYSTVSMEITEEQAALAEIPEGYTGSRIVMISAGMPEMETREVTG